MAITPEQARAELARRELAKRQTPKEPMFSSEAEGRAAIQQNAVAQKQLESNASPLGIAKAGLSNTGKEMFGDMSAKNLGNQAVGAVNTALNTFSAGGLEAIYGAAGQTSIPPETGQFARGAGTAVGMMVPMGTAGKVASTAIKSVNTDKIAGNVVNSLIKPSQAAYSFGKNPGEAVAKEGIVASSLPELKLKIDDKLNALLEYASHIRSAPENVDKVVDLTKAVDPLKRAYGMLSRAPSYHASEINKVKSAIQDLTANKLDNLSVSKAYEIKDVVSKMQNWKVDSEGAKQINIALRDTYHNIDKSIDKAIPELESINSRISNMITASQATQHRANVLMNQEPMPTVMKVMDLPFMAMKTPKAKTLIGALLAKKYSIKP